MRSMTAKERPTSRFCVPVSHRGWSPSSRAFSFETGAYRDEMAHRSSNCRVAGICSWARAHILAIPPQLSNSKAVVLRALQQGCNTCRIHDSCSNHRC